MLRSIMNQICSSIRKKQINRFTKDILILLLLFCVTYTIKAHFFQFAIIRGESMYPTFADQDVILVNQFNYTLSRGDVILIDMSNKSLPGRYIVKRIIAVEGDSINLDYENNTVCVNGMKILEPYLNYGCDDPMMSLDTVKNITYQVPMGMVFVLGDNRNNSIDSRYEMIGMISKADIAGQVCYNFSHLFCMS